ncbi:fluoride efflux transporter CrcB [Sporosarcina sp. SAFN-015]|uniref:fluoride efflux transporter CrcB n=1 Tax=Sporosarcina sp. SAFN-015 TaxID=3387274 RepID=UPI003F7DC3B0
MTVVEAVVIGAGGFVGAILRFFISAKMNKEEGFPIGTLIVNLTGSFLIGLILGFELPLLWAVFLASGLMGALTTFSTLMKELIQLWKRNQRKKSILYSVLTLGLGAFLAYLGFIIGQLW